MAGRVLDESREAVRSAKSYEQGGWKLFRSYVSMRGLSKMEADQEYTITDAIACLIHHANAKGFDGAALAESAKNHVEQETIECCPKCGREITHEWAVIDYGTDGTEEEGRIFYYCSDDCKESH